MVKLSMLNFQDGMRNRHLFERSTSSCLNIDSHPSNQALPIPKTGNQNIAPMVSHGLSSSTRNNLGCLHLMVAALCMFAVSSYAELQRFEHPAKSDGTLSFLVIGDWGRKGTYNQSEVAASMGRIGEALDIDFIISTGDNFYDEGLTGVSDPAFNESFTAIYTAKSLQKQWYTVLGNHDYRGDSEAQLSPVLRKIDPRWLCLRSFMVSAEIADFFMVDTTPFVDNYWNETEHHYNWVDIVPREPYLAGILKDVDQALNQSTAKWKFVIGHHAIRSIGHHGDTQELIHQLLPILKAHGVRFFMNGHDHCLEHITANDGEMHYLTSGAGSKAWRGDVKENYPHDVKFFHDGQGFLSVQLNDTDCRLVFYDVYGEVLHEWTYPLHEQLHATI